MNKPEVVGFVLGGDLCKADDVHGDDGVLARSTGRLRAICEQAPATLPQIKLDLSAEEEEEISASALAALRRLQALWGGDCA